MQLSSLSHVWVKGGVLGSGKRNGAYTFTINGRRRHSGWRFGPGTYTVVVTDGAGSGEETVEVEAAVPISWPPRSLMLLFR